MNEVLGNVLLGGGKYSAELVQQGSQVRIRLVDPPEFMDTVDFVRMIKVFDLADQLRVANVADFVRLCDMNPDMDKLFKHNKIDPFTVDEMADFIEMAQNTPDLSFRLEMIVKHPQFRCMSLQLIADVMGWSKQKTYRRYRLANIKFCMSRPRYRAGIRNGMVFCTDAKNIGQH